MTLSRGLGAILGLCACLLGPLVGPLAADSSDRAPVDITLIETVNLPFQSPEAIVSSAAALEDVRVDVLVNGATVASASYRRLEANSPRSLTWEAKPGKYHGEVRVRGATARGPFTQSARATIDVVPALAVSFGPPDVNLTRRTLEFRATSDVAFAQLSIYDLDGHELHHATHRFDHDRPGKPSQVTWPRLTEPVARLVLRVFGSADSWADLEWSPIQIEVPHGPIFFEDMLAEGKRQRLDQAYRDILKARKANASLNGLRLYLLGVPAHAEQADLAAERARAFGKYLRGRGLDLPILVAASGEPQLDAAQSGGQLQAILSVQEPSSAAWALIR
jgi:hypothetical protein